MLWIHEAVNHKTRIYMTVNYLKPFEQREREARINIAQSDIDLHLHLENCFKRLAVQSELHSRVSQL